ncbi:hypothetical protein HDE_02532 [Halotydeus destructor]|nr:hypothetical protein HDE_02532 [Halotydeus destructor]
MAVSSVETLFQLLARSKDTSEHIVLDEKFIETTSLTLVNWRKSDAIAIYHYVAYLMRKILNDDATFIVRATNNLDESCVENMTVQNDSDLNNVADLSPEVSGKRKGHENFIEWSSNRTSVAIFDGLNGFNAHHFSSTLGRKESLDEVSFVSNSDPLRIFASICKYLQETASFEKDLQLVVLYVDGSYADKILYLLKSLTLSCNVIMITTYIPHRSGSIPNYRQIDVTSDSLGHIHVARYVSCVEEDREDKGLELLGFQNEMKLGEHVREGEKSGTT